MDNSATTKAYKEVIKVVSEALEQNYGNPSSTHKLGENARNKMNGARIGIAKEINARTEEIVFTSGATESNNLAILGLAKANTSKKTIIISDLEHPSIKGPCERLESEGYNIILIRSDKDGIIDLAELKEKIEDHKDILIVSIIHVNNVLGTIQPIYEIAGMCKSKGILFHTDAVQSLGKINIDVKKGIDLLSASAHKIGGPKGVGFLYIRNGVKIDPMLYGGGQEKGIRSGTENVPGILGFAKSLEVTKKVNKTKIKKIRDKLMVELENIGGKINGSKEKRIYNNVNISFSVDSEMLVQYLSSKGIYVSSGSACESKKEKEAKGGIRIVLNEDVTERDIKRVVSEISLAIKKFKIN